MSENQESHYASELTKTSIQINNEKPVNYTKRYYLVTLSAAPIVPLVIMSSRFSIWIAAPVVIALMISFVYAGHCLGLRDAGRGE